MYKKKLFYFADPKSFKYPLFVKLLLKKYGSFYVHLLDGSRWIEADNYSYYGEPVKCIIPQEPLQYDFVYGVFENSVNKDNVFGAINYMLSNYNSRFIRHIVQAEKGDMIKRENLELLYRYFSEYMK